MSNPVAQPWDSSCPCNTHDAAGSTVDLQGGGQVSVDFCEVWGVVLGNYSPDGDGSTVFGITAEEARAIGHALIKAAELAVTTR